MAFIPVSKIHLSGPATGSTKSYSERRHVYTEYLGSYHKIRDEIGFTLGSEYKIYMPRISPR